MTGRGRAWTAEESTTLRRYRLERPEVSRKQVAAALGRSPATIDDKVRELCLPAWAKGRRRNGACPGTNDSQVLTTWNAYHLEKARERERHPLAAVAMPGITRAMLMARR